MRFFDLFTKLFGPSCKSCGKAWQLLEAPNTEPTDFEIMEALGESKEFGFICSDCEKLACERCSILSNRMCPKCGSRKLRTVWLQNVA